MRVVIVEDEYIVRFGIRSMIDWDKLGMTVTGEAANGQEALELMRDELPDILITDIKMPVMDGLALIAEARQLSPQLKILILSNLEDFQYAKEAIRYGVSEYLIKSDMMPRDFERALLQVKEVIERTAQTGGEKKEAAMEPMRREKLLLDLAEGICDDAANLWEELGLPAWEAPVYVLHLCREGMEQGVTAGQGQQFREMLEDMLAEREADYEAFADRQGEINMLLFPGMPAAQAHKWVSGLADTLIQQLKPSGMRCTIGISSGVEEAGKLQQGFEQAKLAVKYKMFVGSGRAIAFGEDYGPAAGNRPQEPLRVSASHIHSMVYAFQAKELRLHLETLFEQLALRKDLDMVQIISLELLIMLTSLWSDVNSDQESMIELKKQYYDQISKLETIHESKAWFIQAFDELIAHMVGVYNSDRNSIIKATQYIQQYYHQEISLQSISSFVHLSKNYFANLFKKEMGESFLEHLTRVRIEKAKTLLTGELKTADIGHLVGIPDPKYFSKVFKKIAGVSPSEYRHRAKG
ncbi:response regulator [Paenibacillus aestuarii]|uniref:Response regulator n=1 Tax=Paenibacillus aestuarii TaxID=516965 RepID=A0ABW0K2V6_9BACL|nr:response regulator [Paenibacillus aestuarii]